MLLAFRMSYTIAGGRGGGSEHLSPSYSIFQLFKSFEFKSSPRNPSCSHLGHTPCLMGSSKVTLSDTMAHIKHSDTGIGCAINLLDLVLLCASGMYTEFSPLL